MIQRVEKIIGAKYSGGNILLNNGLLYFSVGKYISIYDHVNLRSEVLQTSNSTNISILSTSSCGKFLLIVDFLGSIFILNLQKKTTITKISTRERVLDAKFSTGSKFFAVVKQGKVDIWSLQLVGLSFQKVSLFKTFAIPFFHTENNRSLSWSSDDSCIVLGCEDYTCRIFELRNQAGEDKAEVLIGQKEYIIDTHMSNDMSTTYCVTRNGTLGTWQKIKGKWRMEEVKKLNSVSLASSSCFNRKNALLVVGFGSFFLLYDIHLHMQLQKIALDHLSLSSCNFSGNGEVILFGSDRNGRISLWEWKKELMIFTYEGHQQNIRTCAFSRDGSLIATGSADCNVKVWNHNSGDCVSTFSDHLMPVTAVTFTTANHIVISASLDGTVRAFDLIRHRNFRILVGDESGQYSCLAVDSSGDMICAGTCDTTKCSPVKQCWAASTSNGLYLFAEENFRKALFEVAKQSKCNNVIEMIATGSYYEAVSTALGLKLDFRVLQSILYSIPQRSVGNVIKMLSQEHLVLLLEVLQSCLAGSKHLTITLSWLHRICLTRCEVLSALPLSSLTHVLGQVSDLHHMESWNISKNKYALDFVCH
ncbi:unnamed protein product [Bathycoccus prasinos]